ncbi:hypothetical protein INR75_14660 [Zunongwangia sp. SCSIO 43204]|uniref:TlpA family protein disulfide reductase n=1 Tax=Zunongwangia sp. SCSIO 43204 TaxID=2779359 RepID=UPI001CA91D5F|nr:thioredoxin-like domain-containing protein [Zunongwangia sp. SCSIO 43204]UAB83411.1 hypothetical protein INR75_14660 [Zunongwangia sp. SCSIO 43204]
MRNFYTLLLIILFFGFYGCNYKKSKKNNPVKSQLEEKQSNSIVIRGVLADSSKFQSVTIANLSGYSQSESESYKNNSIITDSTFYTYQEFVDTTQFIRLLASTQENIIYATSVFVNPNDTITFKIKDNKMQFAGPKADEFNFYAELMDSVGSYGKENYLGSLKNYKDRIDSIYMRKLNFLDHYVKTHDIDSENFKQRFEDELRYDYLWSLLNPTDEGFLATVQHEYRNNEKFFNYDDYFGKLDLSEFQDRNKLFNFSYRNTLYSLISIYFDTSPYAPFSKDKFIAESNFIEENFSAEFKEFIYAEMFFKYFQHGLGKSATDNKLFKKALSDFKDNYPNSSLIPRINELFKDLEFTGFTFPDKTLNTKVINTKGDTLSFNQVLANSESRIKVLDFWATWCAPCIEDLEESVLFRKNLESQYNVDFIYLSVDINKEDFFRKYQSLKHNFNKSNVYFLIDGTKSKLSEYLDIKWIPNYTILDENNNILINKSVSPRIENTFLEIIQDITSE